MYTWRKKRLVQENSILRGSLTFLNVFSGANWVNDILNLTLRPSKVGKAAT